MGQVQSNEYNCTGDDNDERVEDIADSELNSSRDSSDETNEGGSAAHKNANCSSSGTAAAAAAAAAATNKGNNNDCKSTATKGAAVAAADKIFKLFRPITSSSEARKQHPLTNNNGLRGTSKERQQKQQQQQQHQQQQHHVRKLSNVSNRNIQLLSLKPRSEKDAYADDLRTRRRSSLINLILGAPSSGPKFSDDLCSLSSHMSELCNFGIEFFPDGFNQQRRHYNATNGSHCSSSSLRVRHDRLCDANGSNAELGISSGLVVVRTNQGVGGVGVGAGGGKFTPFEATNQKRRRSSFGSLSSFQAIQEAPTSNLSRQPEGKGPQQLEVEQQTPSVCLGDKFTQNASGKQQQLDGAGGDNFNDNSGSTVDDDIKRLTTKLDRIVSPAARKQHFRNRHPTLTSTMASIDLMSSVDKHDSSNLFADSSTTASGGGDAAAAAMQGGPFGLRDNLRAKMAKSRVNRTGRVLTRAGSELSLYSTVSADSANSDRREYNYGSAGGSDHSYFRYNQFLSESDLVPDSNQKNRQLSRHQNNSAKAANQLSESPARETKSIIMLQVCLPFILAGLGNMAAGLVLNKMAKWRAFREVPIFFVLLPSFVGLKGNIEMTLASRLSTLSNLNLLDSGYARRRAYISNLVLILSQAIGLSVFASLISIICELMLGKLETKGGLSEVLEVATLVVLPSALITGIVLSILSSVIVSLAIALASLIQVNPDNLSTLVAALYGDVSCVLTYGLFADLMFSLKLERIIIWPVLILTIALACYPVLLYMAYKFKETTSIAVSSMPPMLTGIMVSIGSGAILSLVVGRFSLIALYQPVVNGFGANLIAVQASRVSTWLWCKQLRQASASKSDSNFEAILAGKKLQSSLASFTDPLPILPDTTQQNAKSSTPAAMDNIRLVATKISNLLARILGTLFWSFLNPSPNSIAARLLLVMLVPAHTLYFFAIWSLAPANHVAITWQFYLVYISLCLLQVFVLLSICEPLMTLLMSYHLDPDVFGISLLMALADLVGTLCLTGAFMLLARLGDVNAH